MPRKKTIQSDPVIHGIGAMDKEHPKFNEAVSQLADDLSNRVEKAPRGLGRKAAMDILGIRYEGRD